MSTCDKDRPPETTEHETAMGLWPVAVPVAESDKNRMLITDQDMKTMETAMSMKYQSNNHHGIYITEFDKKRLKGFIKFAEERWDNKVLRYLEDLDAELDRAEVVKPEEIPTDVITMNSTFRLSDLDTGEEVVYTLVFPADADSRNRKISVLAPIGTAVLGYRVGDTVEWEVPAGIKRLKVDEIVYQPEAAREYHY